MQVLDVFDCCNCGFVQRHSTCVRCACMYMHIYVHAHMLVFLCSYIYVYTHTYVSRTYMHADISTHVCVCVSLRDIYTHTCTLLYTCREENSGIMPPASAHLDQSIHEEVSAEPCGLGPATSLQHGDTAQRRSVQHAKDSMHVHVLHSDGANNRQSEPLSKVHPAELFFAHLPS